MDERTVKLILSYDGTRYSGWQRQAGQETIQGVVEEHLARITGASVVVHGAGRTDAGVHALAMTASFTTQSSIPCDGLLRGMNSMLPPDIRIRDVAVVAPEFHARKSATGKAYSYQVYTGMVMPPCERLYRGHYRGAVDVDLIGQALGFLVGEHDFGCFEASGSRSLEAREQGAVRTIYAARLVEEDEPDRLTLEIIGSGFLRHMVRNIVGTVMEIGRRRRPVSDIPLLLKVGDRSLAGATAPAAGLFLKEVYYESIPLP